MFEEDNIIEVLKNGGVGVIGTDTIYGIVGLAYSPETVEKLDTVPSTVARIDDGNVIIEREGLYKG